MYKSLCQYRMTLGSHSIQCQYRHHDASKLRLHHTALKNADISHYGSEQI